MQLKIPPQKRKKTGNAAIKGKDGRELYLTFDNEAGTAIAVLDNDTILLKQDTVASGISYSNEQYKYTEWHGKSQLEKNGQVIFSTE